ncbi:RHS repeat-associated core domain-containing protein [Pseudomonas sp. MPC6]|uniref:RHS repeat-associated core domain-containing protein n=1 Tax=unclassified Pseudomonas TaxID=196821 RepID=UPI0011104E52|nr:RHS repeat-associated core domain-containing protein [Pseudomonas sp. MPC6]QCY15124.1 RHS repeat-associated core domain-containing protein [Pseudomonas sp. MPC6]
MPAYPERGDRRFTREFAVTLRVHYASKRTLPMPALRQTRGLVRSPAAAFSRTLLLAPDLQQTILAELDRTGPNRLGYTPYGSRSSLLAAQSSLGFSGQLMERPTGWYHLGNGHRVYNPVLMRFHSPDRLSPFGRGGLNPYVYCSGSPINRVDPSGKSWLSVLGSVVGSGLNLIFAGAAVNRAAAAIVSNTTPAWLTRVGNTLSFWGGATGLPARTVGIPEALAQAMPSTSRSLVSNAGTILSQVSTGAGAVMQNFASAGQWITRARANGQSTLSVLWEAGKEASGWNLVRRQAPGRVPVRMPDVPLSQVRVESAGAVNPQVVPSDPVDVVSSIRQLR